MENKSLGKVGLKRQLALMRLIERGVAENGEMGRLTLTVRELTGANLIGDFGTLERTIDAIKKKVGSDFGYEVQSRKVSSGAADHDGHNNHLVPYAIKFYIDDSAVLTKYLEKIEKDLNKVPILENPYQFVLKDNKLSLLGKDLPPYQMRQKDAHRYELLSYLINDGRYVKTADLADEIGVTKRRVQQIIGQIRSLVHKKFDIPGRSIIESNPPLGYRITNVRVEKLTKHAS